MYSKTAPPITSSNQKTDIPHGGALLQGEGEASRPTTETTGIELSKLGW